MKVWGVSLLLVGVAPCAYGQDATPTPDQLPDLLARFETYAEEVRTSWQVPGMAVAIVADDKVVYSQGFGVKEAGGTDPVDPHTIFQIGSASKAFTSALVAMQVDARQFQWQDHVVDRLSAFMMADPWVTREFLVEDLMAQHSGLPSYAGDLQSFVGFDRAHIVQSLRYLQPVSSFRSKFGYQNSLFLVAAELVEQATGKSWEENVEQRIFQPLGMSESTVGLKGFQDALNVAVPHLRDGAEIVPLDKSWPYHPWVYVYGPAGGVNSNVLDMTRWLRLHLGRGTFEGHPLISADNTDFLHAPKTIIFAGEQGREQGQKHPLWGRGTYYAQGWVYVDAAPDSIVWHNGGTSGCKSVVAFVPEANIGIVVLSNLGGTEVPEILAQWFFDRYFGAADKDWNQTVHAETASAAGSPDVPDPPAQPSPPLPLSTYAGTYRNDVYGEVVVQTDGDALTLTLGPDKVDASLRHWDRDTFVWRLPQLAGFESLASFGVSAGTPQDLTVQQLNDAGDGVFRRPGASGN
jgi:CubicO group peptidase (beta-lactamase class C family)